MDARLTGQVALVTGAGGGLGKAYALALAACGAAVIVNDRGGPVDGTGSDPTAAQAVVTEIEAAGGQAVADTTDVSVWRDVESLVSRTIRELGAVDILVNNAGILRPRTIVGMTEEEMTSVINVHLLGSFAMTHFVACHWRDRLKKHGREGGRLINTTSGSGLFWIGQANYSAAKAGIAALTAVAAAELGRYGATANAIAPLATTRMGAGIAPAGFSADHVAGLVCWLASPAAQGVSGRMFQVGGGHISLIDRCHIGAVIERDEPWSLAALDEAVPALVAAAKPDPDVTGYRPDEPRSRLLPKVELPQSDRPKATKEPLT